VVLIADPIGGQIPDTMRNALIAATSSCIAVGCQSEVDGETEFILGMTHEVNPGDRPEFEGGLDTPNRKVRLASVLGETILEISVREQKTTVRIWVSDHHEPDKVIIGVE
jgi:hypothetical protein